jgi:hypothetical protein
MQHVTDLIKPIPLHHSTVRPSDQVNAYKTISLSASSKPHFYSQNTIKCDVLLES